MPHITRLTEPCKVRHWKVEVDGRTVPYENEIDLVNHVSTLIKKDAFYYKTNFDTKKQRVYPSRQRNFHDGYWVYTFMFTNMKDAAMVKMLLA